jgi:anthranilate phosphoribosyltransferase
MSIAALLRDIGRGRDGAKALAREPARELMDAMLAGRISDLELGAALMALRMKGETAEEIAGFMDAVAAHTQRIPTDRPCVVIPSYNGARLLPNLVPLLALLLARRGVPVLIHGQASEPTGVRSAKTRLGGRVTTLDVLAALGIAPCRTLGEVAERWSLRQPAYVPLAWVAPALARLVALRPLLGLRNVAHTLVKLLVPIDGPAVLLSCHTHAEFGVQLERWFAGEKIAALSLRGTEGEAVVNPQRPQPLALWHDGVRFDTVTVAANTTPACAIDADGTAHWTRNALARGQVPSGIETQAQAIHRLLELARAHSPVPA